MKKQTENMTALGDEPICCGKPLEVPSVIYKEGDPMMGMIMFKCPICGEQWWLDEAMGAVWKLV